MKLPRIILPWPPGTLSPNGPQADFRGKASVASLYKRQCGALLKEKGRAVAKLKAGVRVQRVTVAFCPPSNVHTYDLDNMCRRMKQGFDAIANAIGIDDGKWASMLLERGEKCKDGAVIVEIEVSA